MPKFKIQILMSISNLIKSRSAVLILIWFGCVSVSGMERKMLFDNDWRFHLGHLSQAESETFDDSNWRKLDLPHDWSIEPIKGDTSAVGPFSKMSPGGFATGQTVGGEGWYRKTFTLPSELNGRKYILYFEGAYGQTDVWINGHHVCNNVYGYSSFRCDITPYCHNGKNNTLAVRVVNQGKNSRWYSGSGIFRHVWLLSVPDNHLDEWEVAITSHLNPDKSANVDVNATVFRSKKRARKLDFIVEVINRDGITISSELQKLKASKDNSTQHISLKVNNPRLWSFSLPYLYRAKLMLKKGDLIVDSLSIPFGIREISMDAKNGFQLNGNTIKLRGGCIHHDNGLLGAAAIDRAEYRKVELLKTNGFNAVRCSHNPPSETFLRACDELGLLVIDEAFDQWELPKNPDDYHLYFDEWSQKDLTSMVKRDRNHPSIIMWSIGNEIQERCRDKGIVIAKRLRNIIMELDSTRYITEAVNDFWDNPQMNWKNDSYKAMLSLDAVGYNYMWWEYKNDHEKFPQRVIFGSESVPQETAINWNLIDSASYLIGDFVWTAIDYLGEAGIGHSLLLKDNEKNPQNMGWPWFGAWCGDIDICGNKKPQSYYRDVVWKEREIAMAVRPRPDKGLEEKQSYWGWPNESLSWNWNGYEGKPMLINVYSRAPKVRLYLNDSIIGEKDVNTKDFITKFEVSYHPGKLRAAAVVDGNESSFCSLSTTGDPVSLRLCADREVIRSDKNDLSYISIELVDKNGNVVPNDDRKVRLSVSGKGRICGSGNASPIDMESFRSLSPMTFRGKALAIVQPIGEDGDIILRAESDGIESATLTIHASSAKTRYHKDDNTFYSGSVWNDDEGHMINAHGGGILYHNGTYYWYGECKGDSTYLLEDVKTWECWRADTRGVSCYSSRDLVHWKNEGIVLPTSPDNANSELRPSQVIERPKVIYNEKNHQFVMWMHIESPDYEKAHAGVAVSDSPVGPFTYLGSFKPNGGDSRDQTIFKDDDGRAYHICSSEWNQTLYISLLNDDYTKPSGKYVKRFIKQGREAPAVFKHDGRYYIMTSGCTGWDPNVARCAVADSMLGVWEQMDNPCKGKNSEKTFYAQSTFVLELPDKGGYIAMFDIWNKYDLKNSRYLWLPITFNGYVPVIRWQDQWKLNDLKN